MRILAQMLPPPASPAAASRASPSAAARRPPTSIDTVTAATVDLTASTVDEGAGADYVFTATLSNASHGVTTIHTDQGDISHRRRRHHRHADHRRRATARTSIATPPA